MKPSRGKWGRQFLRAVAAERRPHRAKLCEFLHVELSATALFEIVQANGMTLERQRRRDGSVSDEREPSAAGPVIQNLGACRVAAPEIGRRTYRDRAAARLSEPLLATENTPRTRQRNTRRHSDSLPTDATGPIRDCCARSTCHWILAAGPLSGRSSSCLNAITTWVCRAACDCISPEPTLLPRTVTAPCKSWLRSTSACGHWVTGRSKAPSRWPKVTFPGRWVMISADARLVYPNFPL